MVDMEPGMEWEGGIIDKFLEQVIPKLSLQRVGIAWAYITEVVFSL